MLEGLSAAGLVGCGVGVCGCFVVLLPEELRIRLCRFVVEKTGLRLDLMLKDARTLSELWSLLAAEAQANLVSGNVTMTPASIARVERNNALAMALGCLTRRWRTV